MKNKKFIQTLGYFSLFALGLYLIKTFDHSIFLLIHPKTPNVISYIMLFITVLVNGLIILIFISLFYRKRKDYFLPSVVSTIVVGILINLLLKQYFASSRPVYHFSSEEITVLGHSFSNYSFPSGHAGAAMVLAFYIKGASKNTLVIVLSFLAGILGALSRVYLGVHFPSDVWVGGWIGYWVSMFIFYFFEEKDPLRKIRDFKWNSIVSIVLGICCAIIYLFFYSAKSEQIEHFIHPLLYISIVILVYLLISEFKIIKAAFKKDKTV